MLFSPFSVLYQKISAQLTQYGVMPTGADEVAFKTWLLAAWADSGFTQDFAALYQDASSTTFSVGVRVGSSGHKVNVWWGDGTSNSYTPSTSSNTTIGKTWGSGAKRAIVLIGRITRWEGTSQKYGGRLWENLRSLTYLSCGGCSLLTGSINSLPSGLTFLDCRSCSFTYATSSGSRVWANAMRRIYIAPPSVGIFTSAMVDAILIDLASAATWTNEKSVSIAGNCGAHTAASNAAIATIQGKGVTVTVN